MNPYLRLILSSIAALIALAAVWAVGLHALLWFVLIGGAAASWLWVPWRGLFIMGLYMLRARDIGAERFGRLTESWPALKYFAEARPPRTPPKHIPSKALKLVTLNAFHPSTDLAPKADFCAAQNADVISIVEARPEWQQLAAQKLYNRYPFQQLTRVASNYGHYYMLLLSKHPFVRTHIADEGRIVHYQVHAPQGTFHLVQVHPFSPFTPDRLMARNRAIRTIASLKTALPVVIMGDFNNVPWHSAVKYVTDTMNLHVAGLPEPTFPAAHIVPGGLTARTLPVVPFDFILVPHGAKVLYAATHRVAGTDHLAIASIVELPH